MLDLETNTQCLQFKQPNTEPLPPVHPHPLPSYPYPMAPLPEEAAAAATEEKTPVKPSAWKLFATVPSQNEFF
jgi:hypothetical protein